MDITLEWEGFAGAIKILFLFSVSLVVGFIIVRKKMKKLLFTLMCLSLIFSSCKKDNSNTNINMSHSIAITTPGMYFDPSLLTCNVGDTIIFDLGVNHNALEVTEENFNNNNAAYTDNGFYFDFGEKGYFIPNEAKTYYYVCAPHLPDMKGSIVVQ